MAVFLHQNHLKRSQSNVRYETLCQLVYGTPAFRVEFLLRILKFRNWTYMSYYYSLYHIPVFPLVKSLWLCIFCHPIILNYKHVLRRPLLISRTAIMGKDALVFISQTQSHGPMDFATFFSGLSIDSP